MPLVYAVMGSSRDSAIGAVAVVSILLGTLVRNEIDDIESGDYNQLIPTSIFFAGVFRTVLGICRQFQTFDCQLHGRCGHYYWTVERVAWHTILYH